MENDLLNMFSDHKSEDYYEEKRPEILKLVNPASKKILDVGCGAGVLASELKKTNGAEVWGIEIVESAARKAAEKIDKVLIGNAEEEIHNLPDNYFDLIVLADFIEHLVDPWTMLSNCVAKLTEYGDIIISVPNITHWSVIKLMLNSEFEYSRFGLLDKTHLRFFSRNSAERMILKAGLFSAQLLRTIAETEKIPVVILNACAEIGIDKETLRTESETFQFIFRTFKQSNIEKMGNLVQLIQDNIAKKEYNVAANYITAIEDIFCKLRIAKLGDLNLEQMKQIKTEIEIMKNKLI